MYVYLSTSHGSQQAARGGDSGGATADTHAGNTAFVFRKRPVKSRRRKGAKLGNYVGLAYMRTYTIFSPKVAWRRLGRLAAWPLTY